jgi:hypothetical protein
MIPSVSEFLEERYDEEPHEHGFLYGLAIVNGLLDRSVMLADLKAFLDHTEGRSEYGPMHARAGQLIEQDAQRQANNVVAPDAATRDATS